MNTMIAYCGLNCAECEAYKATQADDLAAKEALLVKWRVEYEAPGMTLVDVTCDGCIGEGRHGGYCGACPVRACGGQKGLVNCAYCDDYESCEPLNHFLQMVPSSKERLDAIRASRN